MPKLNGEMTARELRIMTGPQAYIRMGNSLTLMWPDGGYEIIYKDISAVPVDTFLEFVGRARFPVQF